jgi:hypothetical protein
MKQNRRSKRLSQPKTWTPGELRFLKSLKDPAGIQRFLDRIPYHLADTAWSPRRVLQEKTAHCLEGAIFAAAALRALGAEPLILDLEATNDTDHVIAVYRQAGAYGAIASSNYAGCRFRSPVYRTVRELALSYFEVYYNLRGERTLRNYSRPLNLKRFDSMQWMTTDEPVWFVAEHLFTISHTALITPQMRAHLVRLDQRSFQAGLTGHRK